MGYPQHFPQQSSDRLRYKHHLISDDNSFFRSYTGKILLVGMVKDVLMYPFML